MFPPDPASDWADRFRALGDPNRLKVLALLGRRPHFGEELAEGLGLSPATITHHIRTLRQSGLVQSRREGRYVLHALDPRSLEQSSEFLGDLPGLAHRLGLPTDEDLSSRVMTQHLDRDGKLRHIPFARRPRAVVLRWAANHLDTDRLYPDRELRLVLLRLGHDPDTLRDALLQEGWLRQSGPAYRRVEEIESR